MLINGMVSQLIMILMIKKCLTKHFFFVILLSLDIKDKAMIVIIALIILESFSLKNILSRPV